jgi:hypothetical protein
VIIGEMKEVDFELLELLFEDEVFLEGLFVDGM